MNKPLDALVFVIIAGAFVIIAAQHLGTVPVPETDEAFTLQVPYEMLHSGELSLPMYRYLGGNIEHVWHSYTPAYFLILAGFFKVFGWGLLQGRIFNLITAMLTLLMVFLIGRRLFDWRAGLIATVMLISDQTFFERSRLLRNDYAAAAFAMLAFYLYGKAEDRNSGRLYLASGLAVGAGVMCHTNILYMLVGISILMLLRHGWRVLIQKRLYQYWLGALAVMSYEIIYDLIDFKNFLLQNRDDDLHFGLLEKAGWLKNLAREKLRLIDWYTGGRMFPDIPRTTLHVFQALTVVAIAYLIVRCCVKLKRRSATSDPRTSLLIITATTVLFHAVIVSHKEIYYVAHLVPWFALCVGAMLSDAWNALGRLQRGASERLIYRTAQALVIVGILVFGFQLASQSVRYIRAVRDPELASFEEIKTVLRSVVPEGVCPVALRTPVIWLAFPETDRCFATIEPRMMNALDLSGKDYALIRRKGSRQELLDLDERYHLLAELQNTAYGNLRVYYTGADPSFLSIAPRTYSFFRGTRGYVGQE